MANVIEVAKTGRAKCRACGKPIAAKTQRFGERVPNPFSDDGGETTHWFHVQCAVYTRPEALLALLAATPDAGVETATEPVVDRARLEQEARQGIAHRRLPRVAGAGRSPSNRAVCRACKQTIAKDAWRIALAYYDEGRFAPSGFIHLTCVQSYLETIEVLDRVKHFSPELSEADLGEIQKELSAARNVAGGL